MSISQTTVELAGHFDGADLEAVTAGITAILNIPGFSLYCYMKIAHIAFALFDLRIGPQFNTGMTRRVNHLRGKYSDWTIHGWKSLAKLGHTSANAGFSLHENGIHP